MPKRAIGMFAKATLDSINRAEAMQTMAVLFTKAQFATEDDEELKLEELTWESFTKKLESAESSDNKEAFEERIRALLLPAIQQVFTPQPQERVK